jgi:hypothetical protein
MNVPRTAARASSAVSSWWCSARRRTVFRAAVRVIRGSGQVRVKEATCYAFSHVLNQTLERPDLLRAVPSNQGEPVFLCAG